MSETRKALVAGIMIGEGFGFCQREEGRTYPGIEVNMCDETAVRRVAYVWKSSVSRGAHRCRRTPQNPEGRTYLTRKRGWAANDVMEDLKPHLEGTGLLLRWQEMLTRCPLPKRRLPRRPPRRPVTIF